MTRPLRYQAHTSRDRHEVMGEIQRALGECHGWVLDFRRFSNTALTVSFEIPGDRIRGLLERLEAAGIVVDETPASGVVREAAGQVVPGSLFVQFIHGEPDLEIESPKVPG